MTKEEMYKNIHGRFVDYFQIDDIVVSPDGPAMRIVREEVDKFLLEFAEELVEIYKQCLESFEEWQDNDKQS